MKVIFFGTPPFAATVLEYLIQNGVEIQAVVSRPDRPQGRSKAFVPTPVKVMAKRLLPLVPIFQPEKVSTDEYLACLSAFNPDFLVVVAYGEIIKKNLLDIARYASVNVHASLLPKYRGAAPIQRCIIEGEKETGITIMHMVKKMDAGDMISQEKIAISDSITYGQLQEDLCLIGSKLLLKALQELYQGKAARLVQDESKVTFANKIELEECQLDWNLSAHRLHNLVRGVNPEPGAWCVVEVAKEKKRLKIFQTKVENRFGNPGEILVKNNKELVVACKTFSLSLLEVQLEGKKRMPISQLMNGISEIVFK